MTLLLVVALILGATVLLDIPAVKTQVEHKLSYALKGEVAWDAVHMRLPTPRAVLQGVCVNLPGHIDATVEHAQAQLRLLPLFLGHAEIAATPQGVKSHSSSLFATVPNWPSW